MKAFYSDVFELPLPDKHRFPMAKYRLLRDRIVSAGWPELEVICAPAASDDQLALVHEREYLRDVLDGTLSDVAVRRIGFPWSPELVERSRRSVGATVSAARAAHQDGIAVNLAGGTHHACQNRGQGYCVFNDVAIAIRVLQLEGLIERAIVIDCDVHQGNGTASIFEQDQAVFTFSMHGERNFPFAKTPSDLDLALPDGTGDFDYLDQLRAALETELPLAETDCVFYLAGADPYEDDRLGRLKLTKTGLRERDRMVFETCRDSDLPVVVAMAGGYCNDVEQIVAVHAATVEEAMSFARS